MSDTIKWRKVWNPSELTTFPTLGPEDPQSVWTDPSYPNSPVTPGHKTQPQRPVSKNRNLYYRLDGVINVSLPRCEEPGPSLSGSVLVGLDVDVCV